MKKTIAMLLAGGRGKRLNILAAQRAKPAIPFAGIYRIIDFTLSSVMYSGITNVGILTQYRPSSLMDHISSGIAWDFLGRSRGVKILPPHQGEKDSDWYKGTADAVYQNLDYLHDFDPEIVLILSGDHIYHMDYSRMIATHKEKNADLTIGTIAVSWEEATRYGVAVIGADSRILEFQEKPDAPKSNLASMGIYVFTYSVLVETLERICGQKIGFDFGLDIIGNLLREKRIYSYEFKGYWQDVGTVKSYWAANMDILNPGSGLDLYNWNIRTNHAERDLGDRSPARFLSHSDVRSSFISRGCLIDGSVEQSVLSPGVIVKKDAVVKNSIIMHDCVIEERSYIDYSIFDKDVFVKKGAVIGVNRKSAEKIPENMLFPEHLNSGINVIGKGAVIPEKMKIGKNVLVFPDTDENDYVNNSIPSGGTVLKKNSIN